jgi:hypothetical protein
MKGKAKIKWTIITKKRDGATNEMEKLLMMWMEGQIQKHVTLGLMMIQAKTTILSEDLKRKIS